MAHLFMSALYIVFDQYQSRVQSWLKPFTDELY